MAYDQQAPYQAPGRAYYGQQGPDQRQLAQEKSGYGYDRRQNGQDYHGGQSYNYDNGHRGPQNYPASNYEDGRGGRGQGPHQGYSNRQPAQGPRQDYGNAQGGQAYQQDYGNGQRVQRPQQGYHDGPRDQGSRQGHRNEYQRPPPQSNGHRGPPPQSNGYQRPPPHNNGYQRQPPTNHANAYEGPGAQYYENDYRQGSQRGFDQPQEYSQQPQIQASSDRRDARRGGPLSPNFSRPGMGFDDFHDREPAPPQKGFYQQPQHSHSSPHQPLSPPISPMPHANSFDFPRPDGPQSTSLKSRPPPLTRTGSADNMSARSAQPRRPLIEPISPSYLPQDNAFPVFPTSAKKASKQKPGDDENKPSSHDRPSTTDSSPPRQPQFSRPHDTDLSQKQSPPPTMRQDSYGSGARAGPENYHPGGQPGPNGQLHGARMAQQSPSMGSSQSPHMRQQIDARPPPSSQQRAFDSPDTQQHGQTSGGTRSQASLPIRPGTSASGVNGSSAAGQSGHIRNHSQSEVYANGYIDDIGEMAMSPTMDRDAEIEAEMPDFGNTGQPAGHHRGKTIDEHLANPTSRPQPPMPVSTPNQPYQNQSAIRSAPNMRTTPGPSQGGLNGRGFGPHPANQPPNPSQYQDQYAPRNPYPPSGAPMSGYGPRFPPPRPGTATDQYGRPSMESSRSGEGRFGQSGRAPSAPPLTTAQNMGMPLSKQSSHTSTTSNPDSLPSHPVPVRPGHMVQQTSGQAQQSRQGPGATAVNMPSQGRPQSGRAGAQSPAGSHRSSVHIPVTQAEINHLQSLVNAHPQDAATALLLAKKLVEAADVLASENGRLDARQTSKNRERYIFDAHRRVKKLVSAGYPDAMFYLADCHGQGLLGLEDDPKEAFALYQQAAKAGHAQAAYRTAVCCEMGPEEGGGTRRDVQKAIQWYRRAAQLQDTAAMFKVGIICLKGLLNEPKNIPEAERWLKRAAEKADKDNLHAVHELGLLYEPDNPDRDVRAKIIPDQAYSKELFFKAANLGFKSSQFRLGQAYEYGSLGLPVDARNSIAWYSKAAAQGEHGAELALSGWYLTGAEGILENSDTEAYLWARKSASADPPLAKAMFAMGYYTETGIGCPANLEEAKRWYGRAASYKFPKAIDRLEEIKKNGGKIPKEQKGTRLQRKDVKDSVR